MQTVRSRTGRLMRWSYDFEARALHVVLSDAAVPEDQIEMADGVLAEIDGHGALVGIEVLTPQAGWSISALARRFELDHATLTSLTLIATSPLLSLRAERELRVPFRVRDTQPVGDRANPLLELIPA